MEWQSEQFGAAHEGRAAAVLADGSEPEPVYFDIGSGGSMHRTSDWWVYDGTLRAPLATGLRAACSCSWRGTTRYPVDWDDVDPHGPHLYDTSGPKSDWAQHGRFRCRRRSPSCCGGSTSSWWTWPRRPRSRR
jgi:hypothetical protein